MSRHSVSSCLAIRLSLFGVMSILGITVLLFCANSASAGTMTFSDLDFGLPFDQQLEMPVDYSTGLPAGITATWTGFVAKNANGPDDHTADNDDRMQAFVSPSAGSIEFSSPLFVQEVWMHKTSWGDTGDWPVVGLLGGVEQWSAEITTADMWISVKDGAGIAVDKLDFPQQGLWNHIDDVTFAAVSEPVLGDVNFDGDVNGLDVDPFVEVLLNGTDDNATRVVADMNSDGEVNGLDVDPFVEAVVGGAQSIPEPSTLLLGLLAVCVVVGAWRKWGV
jgi:hypothetical protein